MHTNCRLLFEKYARPLFRSGLRVLEIGPDDHPSPIRKLVDADLAAWDTIDIFPDARLTYVATGEYEFPIDDNAYDIVLATNVLEHVRKPWVWMKELARVCRVGGRVVTINPVSWYFHEVPIDCWRAYPDGMKALCDEAGLTVETCLFESLEEPGFKRYIPGVSVDALPKRKFLNRLLGRVGFPVERAYDTVTIGRKTAGGV